MRIEALTENSCIAYLGSEIDPAIAARVRRATEAIRNHLGSALVDIVPAYASVHVTVDPRRVAITDVCKQLGPLLEDSNSGSRPSPATRTFKIPTYYGDEVAPDLGAVAKHAGIEPSAVASLHGAQAYLVYAIGFAPGFCFLGTTDARLHIPRRARPRTRVPAGSVAIADRQTAVYPVETPGGWHLIGRTHVNMLALCNDPTAPLSVGDRVRFVEVSRQAYVAAGGVL